MKETNKGELRIYWIPQIPGKPFYKKVSSVEEAKLLLETLADYDLFQLDNNIKPEFSNTGGLEIFRNGEWIEWINEYGEDIDEVMLNEACSQKY